MSDFRQLKDKIDEAARKVGDDAEFWDSEWFSDIKREIKEYLKTKTDNRCAYCRRSIKGEHNITLDIEHILEKDFAPRLTLEIDNLTISCRRCNFKKNTIKDLHTTQQAEAEYRASYTYRFIHPNFDNYFDYIKRIEVTFNNCTIIKYFPLPKAKVPCPEKAWFTYENFDLREFERFDLMKQMKIRKPNTILAVESQSVRQYLAEQFEKSHALRKSIQKNRKSKINKK